MRKYLVAAAIGAMLVAGQAAASDSAVVNLGDRIGSQSDTSNQFGFGGGEGTLFGLLTIGTFIALAAWGFSQNGNGHASSP
jgi:hypothetical protein